MIVHRHRVINNNRASNSYKVTTQNVSSGDTLIVTISKADDDKFCVEYEIDGSEVANKQSVHFKVVNGNDIIWSGCIARKISTTTINNGNAKIYSEKATTMKTSDNGNNKLTSIGNLVLELLQEKDTSKCQYEATPAWLVATPSMNQIQKYPIIKKIHSLLTDNTVEYTDEDANRKTQKFDIWIKEPYNFAIEFDEKQHLNTFRKKTFELYKDIPVGFSIEDYKALCNKDVKPGTSGFSKLRTLDKLFPPMLQGEEQDNRARQRAFRDFLKDYLPIINGCKPTIRIPYTVVNKITDFSSEDLKIIRDYLIKHIQNIKIEHLYWV